MLDLDFTFLFVLVNLGILYYFVKKFLFNRLGGFMDKRSEDIAREIEKGQSLVAAGDTYLKEHEEMMANAEVERRELLEQTRNEAEADAREIVRQAKRESMQIIQDAKTEAVHAGQKIEQDSREQIVALAISAASKIIEQNMDSPQNEELVRHFLDKEARQ
ncbi:MAG: F0F1 ATP synthase subunit B [Lachnospiraceae bacterium]|nr:F0F1 ATP synthase subunit B [Lachnospiraceae bacterium]